MSNVQCQSPNPMQWTISNDKDTVFIFITNATPWPPALCRQTAYSVYEDGLVMNNLWWRMSSWFWAKQSSSKVTQLWTMFQIFGMRQELGIWMFVKLRDSITTCCKIGQIHKQTYFHFPTVTDGSRWDLIRKCINAIHSEVFAPYEDQLYVEGSRAQRLHSGRMVIGQKDDGADMVLRILYWSTHHK